METSGSNNYVEILKTMSRNARGLIHCYDLTLEWSNGSCVLLRFLDGVQALASIVSGTSGVGPGNATEVK